MGRRLIGPRAFIRDVIGRMDARLVEGWMEAVSVPTARIRRHLALAGKAYNAPGSPCPPLRDLDRTATWVVDQSRFSGGTLGALAGLGGAASVPPEVLATLVHGLRMAQRLCVVYGFDPETDRGRMVSWQVLASGFEVELPRQGPVGVRVSELPLVLVPRLRPATVGGMLARSMLRSATWMVAGRAFRFVPVLSAGASANSGQRRAHEIGERMCATLRRFADVPVQGSTDDAVEVRQT